MNNENYKEVYFHVYCPQCLYDKKKTNEEPCCDCLGISARLYSHRPEKYEPKNPKHRI